MAHDEVPSAVEFRDVGGIKIELSRHGSGPPLLFLHPHTGIDHGGQFLRCLARNWSVTAVSHPGFGHSELPRWMTTVNDLAYFYLDLIEQLGLADLTLVGSSFGGWIAAEIGVRSTQRIGRLVLADSVGIKISGPDTRDVFDIYNAKQEEFEQRAFNEPALARLDVAAMSDDDIYVRVRNRESAALFTWSPYMFNPKLIHWLHRIRVPTLVLWGESDRITSADYARAFRDRIAGAQFATIPQAGHFPHIEQPERFAELIFEFASRANREAA